jgi:hypothetical protein
MFTTKQKQADVFIKAYYSLKPSIYSIPTIDIKTSGYESTIKSKLEDTIVTKNAKEIKYNSKTLVLKIRNARLALDPRYT